MSIAGRIRAKSARYRNSETGFCRYVSRIKRKRLDNEKYEAWKNKKHIFITGTGRTGTVWLTNLLNRADSVCVVHEPVMGEGYAFKYYAMNAEVGLSYTRDFRLKETFFRCRSLPDDVQYIEITPYLNQHISFLKKELSQSYFIQVVRDGRDVVRSWMTRKTYTETHPVYFDLTVDPKHGEGASRWREMSAFERSCWMWAWITRTTDQSVDITVRFEDIVKNYSDFKLLTDSMGIRVDKSAWLSESGVKKNQSATHCFPEWHGWTSEQKAMFRRICGEQMSRYAYSF